MKQLQQTDPQIAQYITDEQQRLKEQLEMIPSENLVSQAVQEAVGSIVMNKYSEGQVGKRYYQGNKHIDSIEALAKERALQLYKLDPEKWNVCVQAVTGSVANLAVYNALLQPGAKMLAMMLYDGGHLSHGWKLPDTGKPISFTSKVYDSYFYHVDEESGYFDYEKIRAKAKEVMPQIVISGGTAYPRDIDYKALSEIAKEVGAIYMADVAHEAGLIAAGVLSSPFEYADVVTMTTRKTLRGPVGAMIFSNPERMAEIERAVMPGLQGGPMNHSIAGIAVALQEAMQPDFIDYSKQVIANAQALAEELVKQGYKVLSGGTDKHLVLLDLSANGLGGHEVAIALEQANIIVNKNTVPGEKSTPWKPSGIRIGTPTLTSRGMKEADMVKIAGWMHQVMGNLADETAISKVAEEVKSFASGFPVRGV
ncbi:MAG: serine hydroxymethyltransferase [Candidatus Dojkabacteria bacterium]|nr:MAG: serine hydroxymethyltransferase [Candidatus Dojkabacteria bacterium]